MIPTRTICAICEIATGTLVFASAAPTFTGENHATEIEIHLKNGGESFAPAAGTVAELYFYWPASSRMTETVQLIIDGDTLTGTIPEELTGVAGCPLLVIQMIDTSTGALVVTAAAPIQIVNVRGSSVISSRAPTPAEIIYVGRAPYIGQNGDWYQWDTLAQDYIDTGIVARGLPATFSVVAVTLPAGSSATAEISGTAENPILTLGIPRGQDSAVLSVNGKTGSVQLNDEDIPSTVGGATNVEGALSGLDNKFANYVPTTRKVNGKALSADVTLAGSDIVSGQLASGNTVNQDISSLNSQKVNVSDIKNNLTSTDTNKPLSAYQGKVLKDSMDTLSGNVSKLETVVVNCGTISSLPVSFNDSRVEDDMVVLQSTLGTPSAQTGDWTVTTNNGSITISGSISGSTTLILYLTKSR